MSSAQERLWFLEQLEPGTSLYNVSLAFRLIGPLAEEALQSALDTVVARHEVLRTTYEAPDGLPVQLIHPPCPVDWAAIDVSKTAEGRRDGEVQARVIQEARRSFDLSSDLMLRARLLRLAPNDHVLLLVTHHIATDGWSTDLLLHELSVLYTAKVRREEPDLPVLPVQYADCALRQREHLQGSVFERDLAYWRRQLEGVSRLSLPTDRARSAEFDCSGAAVSVNLPPSLADPLKRLGREEKSTLFMVLLGAMMVFLRSYSGQDDICVGAPIAGRTRADQENLVGFFVNMLILRQDLSGEPTFRDVLRSVRHTCLEAYEHQELPFERLVSELQPTRVRNQNPFFQVTLALQHGEPRSPQLAGLISEFVPIPTETSKFDLGVKAQESTAGLLLTMTYSTAMFDRSTAQHMLQHLYRVCEAIGERPAEPIDSIPLAIDCEAQERFRALNQTDRSYPRESTIQQEFENQVAKTPDAIAVVFGSRRMTYGELSRRSDHLAHHLRRAGAQPESLVGVYMERSPEMIVSLLAILKAGAGYVPLDPHQPRGRLQRIIELSRPACVLSHSDVAGIPLPGSVPTLVVDELQDATGQEQTAAPFRADGTADGLAYVMFTSGSTGRPKGVEVTHRGVLRLTKGIDYVDLADRPRILQLASLAFDASTFEIWGALLNGGQCVLSTERIPSVSEIGSLLRDFQIDILWLTATWFNAIVAEDPTVLSTVRQLIIGGEPLSVPHVVKALRVLQETSIVNGYGPTEGTTFACCYQIPADFDPRRGSIPIGHPISNTEVYVLDSRARPTPVGVPGELCIGGDGLARGYLEDPILTAERFIPNPFTNRLGGRLYRTGDRVRLLPSGEIEYLGRLDRQLKIRGFRIEPGEIEHALKQHPDVGDVRVVLHDSQRGDPVLVAYVLPAHEGSLALGSLKAFVSKQLPEYMIPALYVPVPEFPLTPGGKTDHRALPAPSGNARMEESSLVPPRTKSERRMHDIWHRLLTVEHISIRDSFFDLGGHSLLAVRLIARIENAFGVRLSLAALFDHPTIEALGQAVDERHPRPSRSTVVCLQKGDGGPPFFCIPPAASSVNHFARLVQALSPDIPFYGIQALGLESEEVPQDRMEEMAARYIADMRAIQPSGPYFIGGRCLGGYVAYEMALQLLDHGEDVALLALLDPPLPPGERRDLRYYVWRAGYFRRRKQLIRAVLRRAQWTVRQAQRLRVLRYLGSRYARRIQRTYKAHLHAQNTYVPRVYSEKITFFASRKEYAPDDSRPLWKNLTSGGFELHLVPGTHRTMSQGSHLQTLAQELENVIREARLCSRTADLQRERQS
ncbi:amino acid adenylation domain-containing protein [Candidatus Bipolaricaulota bacterium]